MGKPDAEQDALRVEADDSHRAMLRAERIAEEQYQRARAAEAECAQLSATVARLEALAKSDSAAMDLWWTVTGDDWAVPEWLPGKFLLAALTDPTKTDATP